MRVKICGITNYEDAMLAIKAGADALGFVLYEKSPRYIEPKKAKELISKLPPFVEKVALYVNKDAQTIDETTKYIGATLSQIHFDVDKSFFSKLKLPHLKVVRAQKREDVRLFGDSYRLVDAFCESYGGSGKRLNLEWFEGVDCSKIILAGGLTPTNVAEVAKYGFYGVDVSSGVEATKGKKDPKKLKEFIKNAKNA